MQLDEVMAELESKGTEKNRRLYPKHGAKEPMFGVSYADLGALKKRIGSDHALAMNLWATGNHDARVLACQIADPEAITVSEANSMVTGCENYVVADALAMMLAASPIAAKRAALWRNKQDEWTATAGWALTASLPTNGNIDTPLGRELLDQIEAEVADRPNRVRHEMNQCVITLGLLPELHDRAIEVAAAISPVEVDHGATSCKTPDAAAYITKTLAHRAKQAEKRAAKAQAKR